MDSATGPSLESQATATIMRLQLVSRLIQWSQHGPQINPNMKEALFHAIEKETDIIYQGCHAISGLADVCQDFGLLRDLLMYMIFHDGYLLSCRLVSSINTGTVELMSST